MDFCRNPKTQRVTSWLFDKRRRRGWNDVGPVEPDTELSKSLTSFNQTRGRKRGGGNTGGSWTVSENTRVRGSYKLAFENAATGLDRISYRRYRVCWKKRWSWQVLHLRQSKQSDECIIGRWEAAGIASVGVGLQKGVKSSRLRRLIRFRENCTRHPSSLALFFLFSSRPLTESDVWKFSRSPPVEFQFDLKVSSELMISVCR